jgi:hypothetical protein
MRLSAAVVLLCAGSALALAGPALAQVEPVNPITPRPGFRVLPYLMNPTAQGMTINWFTTQNTPGTLSVTGPGLASPLVLATTPELQDVLDYQFTAETGAGNFAATRVTDAGGNARNWKHSIVLSGLQPGATYSYTVTQPEGAFSGTFTTAPLPATTRPIRLHVLSDSETLIIGRTTNREWSRTTPQAPGSTGRPAGTGRGRSTYFLTETYGYQENIKAMEARDADLVVMPGDLIQGTTDEQQRRWDEFWRHNAGEYDDFLSNRPLIAAIGNNCIFAGGSGTGPDSVNARISFSRRQWSTYFDFPASPNPAMQDLYSRTDFGPITIITLCVVKAVEPANHLFSPDRSAAGAPLSGANFDLTRFPPRDTNRAWADQLYTFGDMPDFNVGTEQWNWAAAQLADARADGQIIFVQWHHTPYSRGVHGSFVTSNQSGEATRIYTPLFEQFRVAGVFCGHSEVKERSFVDADNDGYGIHYWDVGAAGDGLRGVEDAPGAVNPAITTFRNTFNPSFQMNPFSQWSADQSEPELWNGTQLVRGGKHYGFLEVDVTPLLGGNVRINFQPYHVFPLNTGDANFTVTGTELRAYSDTVVLSGPAGNLKQATLPLCPADINGDLVRSPEDIFDFLAGYFARDTRTDIDGQPGLTPEDIFTLLTVYFSTACD